MKKLIVTLFISVLLIVTFIFVFKMLLDKPIFDTTKNVDIYLDGIKEDKYNHIFTNNQIYINANYLKQNELLDYYWDNNYNKISIFNDFKYDVINYNNKKAFYNKIPFNINEIIIIENNELYFNSKFINDNYVFRLYVDIDNLKVIIEEDISEYEVVKKSRLKSSPTSRAITLKKLDIKDSIYVYNNEYNGWILARTEENAIGYVKLSDIRPISKTMYNTYESLNNGKKIRMAWDLVYIKVEEFEPFNIPYAIDIVGPTWFELEDTKEKFKDLSNDDYINFVKDSNKDIWAVFNNRFDPDLTSELLNNGIKRSEIADKIIDITLNKGFDAINLDFENIHLKDKDVFSAFVKELYCKAKEKGILFTIDITIMSNAENWSLCYDRNVVGKYSDYIMLMAYDENVSGVIGSVSSLPWVEYGVNNLLEYASSEKIVLSIPFYTRLWEEHLDNQQKVKSTALRIGSANKAIEELGINLIYDDSTGQNFGEIMIDDIKYTIWNEDETSLVNRLDIIKKYNLSGYAVWAFKYGTDEMWELLKNKK
ncbi:spore germination protein YaaH [Sedimentibacter acidaminivorans]|uniref:Spore germination protein YaaH n=1 Tax=Sedimentibacter acidaminivorans TaxID=913099 RepID=A0ABS4GHN8_9FIRM|nr:glycosyl hydrolase family 18 protein [Sedimentibacter acidaminivorans]MBP1927198.1 spore germination protein YaaH [Sedimentibacter acidaminivorans]